MSKTRASFQICVGGATCLRWLKCVSIESSTLVNRFYMYFRSVLKPLKYHLSMTDTFCFSSYNMKLQFLTLPMTNPSTLNFFGAFKCAWNTSLWIISILRCFSGIMFKSAESFIKLHFMAMHMSNLWLVITL